MVLPVRALRTGMVSDSSALVDILLEDRCPTISPLRALVTVIGAARVTQLWASKKLVIAKRKV